MFNYDWFHGPAYQQQLEEARTRCLALHRPELDIQKWRDDEKARTFRDELEVRTLIYLRDGFSYEVKHMVQVDSQAHLVFECEPLDDRYKVGAFVVTLPFDEISRVEVFSVHPDQKPDDLPQITGFRGPHEPPERPPLDGSSTQPMRAQTDG